MELEFIGLEWDEKKRLNTIARRNLDFMDVAAILEGPVLLRPAKTVKGEERSMAIGLLDDVRVAVIFTWRGLMVRVISMRRARDEERRSFDQAFGR